MGDNAYWRSYYARQADRLERERDAAQNALSAAQSELTELRGQLAAYREEVAPLLTERDDLLKFMANINRVAELGGTITLRPKGGGPLPVLAAQPAAPKGDGAHE